MTRTATVSTAPVGTIVARSVRLPETALATVLRASTPTSTHVATMTTVESRPGSTPVRLSSRTAKTA